MPAQHSFAMDRRSFFELCFDVAIDAAMPDRVIANCLPKQPQGRLVIVGAGKGAAQLARALEQAYQGEISGVVVTRYGFGAPCSCIQVLEAGHPLPDENSLLAARIIMDKVSGLTADDHVVSLITGGGSALLAAPLPPMVLEDEIELNRVLLSSGLPIGKMNTIRRHSSAIKGGRLAHLAHPAKLTTYVISDVLGDDPAEVASGPTVAANTTPQDAIEIIDAHHLEIPENLRSALASAAANCPSTSGDVHILASSKISLDAVEKFALKCGRKVLNLGEQEGEARALAQAHGELVKAKMREGWRGLILSGGETTVNLQGSGKGGRNSEYALALALALEGARNVTFFAADTDGVDGSEKNAGVFGNGESAERMRAQGINPLDALQNNDSYTAFAAIDTVFVSGPTGTNVNDLRLILIS